jgi:8-oxo-dGTP diphosphatase
VKAGAFGIIFDEDDRVLLCHRRDIDAWNLPGGGVEEGEMPWEAAVREIREEVGVEAEVVRLTGLYWLPGSGVLVFNFECRVTGGSPTTSDEADAVDYFAFDELPANTAPKQVERIADALVRAPVPFLKSQSGPGIRDLLRARAQ